jgi:hypothetical protein
VRTEDLILTRFPIPPVIIRPTAKIDFLQSSTMEDSLTLKIADIINANKRVRAQMDKDVVSNELSNYNQDINNPSFVSPLFDKMASQQTIWIDSVNENDIRKRESLNKYFISGN